MKDAKEKEAVQPVAWRRPAGMPETSFRDFVADAERAIGAENRTLLEDVAAALADPARMPALLTMDANEAKTLAAASDVGEERYLAYLSLLHEIEWRKSQGAHAKDPRGVAAPCPDFLPASRRQVPKRRARAYAMLSKVRGWALAAAIAGIFPLAIVPTCGLAFLEGGTRLAVAARIARLVWLASLAAFASAAALRHALKGPAPARTKEM